MDDQTNIRPIRRQPDLTTGPINRTLLFFALPTLGSNILQSLNGSINAIWVGKFLGEDALAATSNAGLIMFLMFGAVFGFGMAATILVGQSFGARDLEGAKRAFGSAIGLVFVASVVVAAIGWVFAPEILDVLGTPGDAYGFALSYLRVIFLGLPSSMLLIVMMMGLRGSGDSMTPLWFMVLSVAIDAGLNPFLIAGIGPFPKLGIAGSALANLIANTVSLGMLVAYMHWRDMPLRLKGGELRWLIPEAALMRTIVAKGVPIGAQMLVMSTSALAMVGMVNREGVATAAAYGVTQQLWAYVQMPAMAIGAAVSAMAAQNIGAGRWDRVGAITRGGLMMHLWLTGSLVIATTLLDRLFLGLFLNPDSAAMPIAQHIQAVVTWGFVLFGMSMVFFGVVRANGSVLVPLAILFIAMYPVRIGVALALRPMFGIEAVWWSFPLGSAATLLMAWAYYAKGGWRNQVLAVPPDIEEVGEQSHSGTEPTARLHPTG
jgi:putative MATE family efflux protein